MENEKPEKLFFKGGPLWEQTNLIDRSSTLSGKYILDGDLTNLYVKSHSRLLVYINHTDAITFEREVSDILQYNKDADISLLSINYGVGAPRLDLSLEAGVEFTDQEAQEFITTTMVPALNQGQLEYAVASAVEKFSLELTKEDFYTPSQLRRAKQSISSLDSVAHVDIYDYDRQHYSGDIALAENQLAMYIVTFMFIVCVGIYNVWRSPQKGYGFILGIGVGFAGYTFVKGLNSLESYFGYDGHLYPLLITVTISGLVDLFIDYLVSLPHAAAQKMSRRKIVKPKTPAKT